jgi:hypothetical protein
MAFDPIAVRGFMAEDKMIDWHQGECAPSDTPYVRCTAPLRIERKPAKLAGSPGEPLSGESRPIGKEG